jgi:hypothetical protein
VKKMATIYFLTDPQDGFIRYVGVTTRDLRVRLAGHMSGSARRKDGRLCRKDEWISGLKAMGFMPIIVGVERLPVEKSRLRESRIMWQLRGRGERLLNRNDTGTKERTIALAEKATRRSERKAKTKLRGEKGAES